MQRTLPVVFQRKLLQDFVRQADNAYNVCVFEILGWTATEENQRMSIERSQSLSERDSMSEILMQQIPPDIIIPFVMQVEIGVRAQIEHFRNVLKSHEKDPHEVPSKDVIAERDTHLAHIDLAITYVCSSMRSGGVSRERGDDAPKSKSESFASLSFSNFPMR